MNKLLPAILIVSLSGCAWNPLAFFQKKDNVYVYADSGSSSTQSVTCESVTQCYQALSDLNAFYNAECISQNDFYYRSPKCLNVQPSIVILTSRYNELRNNKVKNKYFSVMSTLNKFLDEKKAECSELEKASTNAQLLIEHYRSAKDWTILNCKEVPIFEYNCFPIKNGQGQHCVNEQTGDTKLVCPSVGRPRDVNNKQFLTLKELTKIFFYDAPALWNEQVQAYQEACDNPSIALDGIKCYIDYEKRDNLHYATAIHCDDSSRLRCDEWGNCL